MTQSAVRPDAITVETGDISSLNGRNLTRLLTQADARGHMAVPKIRTSLCETQGILRATVHTFMAFGCTST
jgi:hypothetical protein